MASYHVHISEVQRSKGHNAIASAAYISRSKLTYQGYDYQTGVINEQVFDYSEKYGLAFSRILAPGNVPEWVYDREKLWNNAEHAEKRKDAETARKIVFALPKELTPEQNFELVKDFVEEYLVSEGMIVDMNIHYDREHNPHAHLQMSTRALVELENGEVVFGLKNLEWGRRQFLHHYREAVSNVINKHLEFHGVLDRVSHLSHKARGIELIPGVHRGPANHIKASELARVNDEIVKENTAMIRDNPELIFQKLSISKPVFTPEDIAKTLSEVLYSGVEYLGSSTQESKENNSSKNTDIEQLNAKYSTEFMVIYEQLLSSKNITLVNPCDLKGRTLYALTKRIQLEQRYEQTIEKLASNRNHTLNITAEDIGHKPLTEELLERFKSIGHEVQRIINEKTGLDLNLVAKERPSLTAEQRQAVVEVLNGSDISIIEGWPGAGKTHSMREIVKQYQRAGYKVLGAAPSSAAALNLAKAAGIEAKNIAQWRKSWQKTRGMKFELALRSDYYSEAQYQHQLGVLDSKTVLIVDEASMVELANMDYLVSEVRKSGAKIILVGDNNQFAAVGMTGAFKKAGNIAGRSRLTEIMRHQHPDPDTRDRQREATKLMGQYNIPRALEIYRELGVFRIDGNAEDSKAALVKDYVKEYLEQASNLKRDDLASVRSIVIGAYTNVAVNHFNIEVRERLKQAGVLKGTGARFLSGNETVELLKGEQIVFETNKVDRQDGSGVLNGEVATVIDFEQPDKYGKGIFRALVHKADGSKQVVNINTGEEKFPVRFKHGYAVTGYKLQGETVDHMRVYYEQMIGYEAFNVLMSRHKVDVKMYASNEVLEDIVYKRINEDVQAGREKFDIKAYSKELKKEQKEGEAPKELPSWYVGLALGVSKRVDNSFANDYRAKEVLSDNELVIKDYLESRELLFELYDKVSSWKQRCQQPLAMNKLKQSLSQYFVLKEGEKIGINPNALIFAIDRFDNQDGNISLKEYIAKFGGNGDKADFSELTANNKNLAIWHALSEHNKEELSILFEELGQTRKELRGHADNICRHYNGWVDRALQEKIAAKEKGLEDKYADIQSNWIKAQRIKLSKSYNQNTVKDVANEQSFNRALEVYKDLSEWVEKHREQENAGIINAPDALWGINAADKFANRLLLTTTRGKECGIIKDTFAELENFEQEKDRAIPELQALKDVLHKTMAGVINPGSKWQLTMGEYLTQLNLNYETIQKHAGISSYKYYLQEIEAVGAMGGNDNWQEMMKASEVIIRARDNRKFLSKAEKDEQLSNLETHLKAVNRFVYEVEGEVFKKSEELKSGINEHKIIEVEKNKLENYRESLIKEYFSRVYKTPINKVIKNWESLVENNPHGTLSDIARHVKSSPSLLGELKGIGFGKIFSLTKERHEAITGVEVLNERLIEYEQSGIKLEELNGKLDEGNFIDNRKKLTAEIAELKQLLPSKYEREFIEKLTDLEQSNNFTFEKVGKIVVNDDVRGLVLDYYNSVRGEESLAKEQEEKETAKDERMVESDHLGGSISVGKRARRPRLRNRNAVRETPLTFEQVNKSLTGSHFEQIFRDHAHSINSDGGKIRKQGNHLSCGSLSMNISSGSWNRFSTGDKGDIYGFVEHARGFSKKEALEFVADIAGVEKSNKEYKPIEQANIAVIKSEKEKPLNEWCALYKVPDSAPKFEAAKHLRGMLKGNECRGIYEYRNVKGELLGYSVRLVDKESGDKQVLPVAWCRNAALGKESWRLKGFSDNGDKPIYGAEKLADKNKPILIVEGEKTANKAQELLPEYTVVSWLGGSGSADKVNWGLCKGKEVIIWPDNDAAGTKAATSIASKLNRLNGHVGLISVVDPATVKMEGKVQLLPKGWDLADELPENLQIKDIRETISNVSLGSRSIERFKTALLALKENYSLRPEIIDRVEYFYWQQLRYGIEPILEKIIAHVELEKVWLTLLEDKGVIEFNKYATARGLIDNTHEYLNIENSKLYRATFAAIAINQEIELTPAEADTNRLSRVFNKVEEEYLRSRTTVNLNQEVQEKYLSLLPREGASVQLYSDLLRDAVLLQRQRLNTNLNISELHHIADEVYKVLKPYSTIKEFTDFEKVELTEKLFDRLNSKELLQENLKEQLAVAKKTIGLSELERYKISVSHTDNESNFIEIANSEDKENRITILTMGLETALAIKQAGIDAKIICALGISNIKNYAPKENERVIIAADNDGEASVTSKITLEAANTLRMRGAAVRIVKPKEIGDFNDSLQKDKVRGTSEIQDIFRSVISSLNAKTLNEFFAANRNINLNEPISTEIQEDISYLKKYGVNEDEILNSFKSSYAEGLNCLKKIKEQTVNAEQIMQGRGERIIKESRLWGSNLSDSGLINELIAMPQSERINSLEKHRSEVLNNYLKTHLNNFDTTKLYATSLPEVFEAVEKEQKFLADLGSNIQDDVYKYKIENGNILRAARAIHEKPELFEEVKAMAEEAISTGVLHPAEVSYLFKNELSMSNAYETIDTAFEKHHIKTGLASFKQDKGQAETPQEFLRAALNEQEFLISLDGNLKYSTFDRKLQTAIAKAHEERKEEVIDKLEKVIEQSINAGISTNDKAIRILQSTLDLKSTYTQLDQAFEMHEIQTNLNNYAAAKLEAKLPEELITIFTEEQKYLAELKDNIKYPDRHSKNLLDRVAEARLGQQDNIIPALRKTLDDSIEIGFKDDSIIIEELKNTDNLKATYVNLDRELENRLVQTNLNNYSNQKAGAKTTLEILQITNEQQEFLASLHNNIKYTDGHSQDLLDSIEKAHSGQQDKVMRELHNVSVHIIEHKIIPEQDLLRQLKTSEDIHATVKELTKSAVEHYGSFVNTNINRLLKGEGFKMNNIIFDCPMKYLRHEIDNPAHAYADIAKFKSSVPRLQEIMNKLALKKEHEHSMGGMSM